MIEPNFTVTVAEENKDYAKLVLEPLTQGYGHTVGNALRRVLLASLPGAAITSIKIKGVNHQFTTLNGMSEDIVELVLNIKSLRIRLDGVSSATLRLEATGPGEVKASQIELPVGVTISNPDTVICHLADSKNSLNMEMMVETGWGYSTAEERKSNAVGVIPVDAFFSPIKRVNPKVESTRVGRRTDFDKLILEIWTDETMSAKLALEEAAKILVNHFRQIYDPVLTASSDSAISSDPLVNEVMKLTVEELNLPTRIANALRKGGYKTVADLSKATKDDVAKVKNLGERSVSLVTDALKQKGISLVDA
jgi:DNA-directed RNA polymerase subunit alpha